MSDLTRVTVNLTPPAVAALERITVRDFGNRTDSICRALVIADHVLKLAERNDGKLAVLHADGERETVVFL